MKIRLARDEDYKDIARLRRDTIHNVNSKDYSESIIHEWITLTTTRKLRENAHKYKRWVAVEKEKTIGFCDHKFKCELSRIYVHKDHLRKGVGSRLLKVAEASLKKQGCKKITIKSTITAKTFYQKNGYKVVKKATEKMENKKVPIYIMSKKLSPASGLRLQSLHLS